MDLTALDFDNLSTGIMATIRADVMREMFLTAVRAYQKMRGVQCVVRPSAIPPAFRQFPFRKRWHVRIPRFSQERLPSGQAS
jgi:hypothetical protein